MKGVKDFTELQRCVIYWFERLERYKSAFLYCMLICKMRALSFNIENYANASAMCLQLVNALLINHISEKLTEIKYQFSLIWQKLDFLMWIWNSPNI